MSAVIVIGVDPGPIPGTVGLLIEDDGNGPRITDAQLAQTTAGIVGLTVGGIVMRWKGHPDVTVTLIPDDLREAPVLIGVEKFVVGHRATRSSSAGAGAVTRDMVGVIERCGIELGAVVVQRTAKVVKDWATDERLARAGLEVPSGMRHAKDAARHALYAAVHAEHLPDPLSSRYKKPRPS